MRWTLKASLVIIAFLALQGCGGAPRAAAAPEVAAASVEVLQAPGDAGNRVNLVLLGDGYRLEDQDKLSRDARNWLCAFRAAAPFSNYADYFNVKLVHLVSAQDGAGNGMHGAGVARDTALGAAFENASPEGQAPDYRLLVVDNARALAAAMAAAPECTQVLVLVNDTKYGGSGGVVPAFSAHPEAGLIALHELGHAFGGLADEYQCGDTSALPAAFEAFPNVTAQREPGLIKWKAWIDPLTPLPTPATWARPADLGLFEGAAFHDTGVFRPRQACRMRSLTDAFCPVCSEAIVRRLYAHVNPLDGASPASDLAWDAKAPLSLAVTRPVPAPDTFRVAWTVDGAPAGEGDGLTLPPGALGPGAHRITAQLVDATPLVRTGAERLAGTHTWTVNGGASPAALCVAGPARHLLLRVERTPSGFRVVERKIVPQPLPPAPDPGAWRLDVAGPGGEVAYQAALEDPTALRGEFQHGADPGGITGHRLGAGRPMAFLVRLPVLETGRLDLHAGGRSFPVALEGDLPAGAEW